MIDLNLICSVAESWCDQLSVCCYLQEERQGCLRSVLATLVFISTIIEVPHAIKRVLHLYAVIEQTIHTESSWVLYISELRKLEVVIRKVRADLWRNQAADRATAD
jgi:hypothetical protein